MNLIAIAVSAAALISSVAANISFALPTSGAIWYTRTPNYMSVISNNAAEQYATVRFSACRECFALTVATNTTVPIILPRHFRSNNYLNLFAVSNSMNTASTLVSVIDSLCIVPGNPCKKPCKWERRRGCGYYAQESANAENDASQAELVYVAHDSEEAKAMKAQQEQAAADFIPVVVAAGNSNIDACTQTPAAVAEAITVAASTQKNTKAKFSNFGPCVDIFAPGVDILAATTPEKSRNGWNFASGTSFAAPMVAGVAALLLEKNPDWTPAQLADALNNMSAKAVLDKKSLGGSPNILLQSPSSNSKLPILVKLANTSYLPMLGYHSSSIVSAELVLVICSFVVATLALLTTGLALYRRKRKIKLTNNTSISEEELKHSVINSQRPSVFL